MKTLILFRGDFDKLTFETILYNLDIPKNQRKNVIAIELKIESFNIILDT